MSQVKCAIFPEVWEL